MKNRLRLLIALGIGFAAGIVIMTIAIYFGYSHAYADGGDSYSIRIIGLKIYELTREGSKYSGTSVGINMGAFCGICMAAAVVIAELLSRKRRPEKNEKSDIERTEKNKLVGILFYIASICFYVLAFITILVFDDSSAGAVWISIGTVMLVLGSGHSNKSKKS